ncbi:MAG: hypothetical protein AB1546_10515 [bacterium]
MIEHTLQCIAFFAIFGFCAANAQLLTRIFLPAVGLPEKITSIIVAAVAQIVLITTVLGAVGLLGFTEIFFSLLAAFVFLSFYFYKNCIHLSSGGVQNFSKIFSEPWIIILSVLSFTLAGFLFVWAVITPPPASDAFLYHLPLPVRWLQTGSIIPDSGGPFARSFHPSNPEALFLWLILPFHEDILTNSASWFFWAACALTVYSLVRHAGGSQKSGIIGGVVWLFLPEAVKSAASSEADLFASFFVMTSLVFLFRYTKFRNNADLLWGSASLGIFLGSKLTALAFSMPIVVVYLFEIFQNKKKKYPHFLIFCSTIFIFSGFWFIGNLVLTGNPLHPYSPGGAVSRAAVMMSPMHTSRLNDSILIFRALFGTAPAMMTIPFWLFAVCKLLIERRWISIYLFILPVIMFIIFWHGIGLNQLNSARYLFPAAAIAIASWGVAFPSARRLQHYFYLLCVIAITASVMENGFLLKVVARQVSMCIAGLGIGGFKFLHSPVRWLAAVYIAWIIVLLFLNSGRKTGFLQRGVIAIIMFTLSTVAFHSSAEYYTRYKYSWYSASQPGLGQAWQAVDRIEPKPVNIGYAGTNLSHGFYGRGLKNHVYKVEIGQQDYNGWKKLLERWKIQVLVTHTVHPFLMKAVAHDAAGFPVEDYMARTHPETFEKIFDYGKVRVYIVRR